ncbi:MAG TPA: glycosyltransferase family 1 protein [Gammaproteobacteria bacterium]|nr:glycosyltransferase family 1 protein [Gammaproteobacteria bacterium]
MTGKRFSLEVQPHVPERLSRLNELANDLFYSWDRQVRGLFHHLDPILWEACQHNPKVFMRRVSQERLEDVADDRIFMEDYERALSAYDIYQQKTRHPSVSDLLDDEEDLVAYFCAEFGLHESVPIYSGGLGILAGDHCKAASDLGLPFIGVGLLYRQGYFTQTIDGQGNQIAHYTKTHFGDLPISPALDSQGEKLKVQVGLPGRTLTLKVWQAKAGHITLYLLDSDLETNSAEDRTITRQLYGGDINTRIQQEIVLGIGGVRALRAMGLKPSVWHINEGHAAFQILERCREYTLDDMPFDAALELVAANTVFTTHTPVPAGHDIFDHHQFSSYFKSFVKDLHEPLEHILALGHSPDNPGGFNMTALALRGSRFHNGVSRIHGTVASQNEGYVWPQIPAEENPIDYVTNGVHLSTFLAREWFNLFDMTFDRSWRNEQLNEAYWQRIDEIPDQSYWSIRQTLKSRLFADVRHRLNLQLTRNGCGEFHIQRLTSQISEHQTDILTLGFARRFATYKRATLMFSDPQRLARLLNDPQRPVVIIFAGKAHPNDQPGQELIRTIHHFSRQPEFEGKIILLEGYDLALARKLVSGVDVWVNNPEYPMEASGTSGEKAGLNGVLNLSVLDGWWGEGFNGENGWGIVPHGSDYAADFRDREEGQALLDILENDIIPSYYERNGHGYSEEWVRMSKNSMKSILPQFNSQRMVMDYLKKFYAPASRQKRKLLVDEGGPARELAAWKKKIHERWHEVSLQRIDNSPQKLMHGDTLKIEVSAYLDGLASTDLVVECLVGTVSAHEEFIVQQRIPFHAEGEKVDNRQTYCLDLEPVLPGLQYYKIRAYPYHQLQTHPFETGCMIWL